MLTFYQDWRRDFLGVSTTTSRNTRGGTIIIGSLNFGGSIERIPNPIAIAKLAVAKQAATLLPVASRCALNDLPDELWTKVNIEFYLDPVDAVFKSLVE